MSDVNTVKRNISGIYDRRKAALFALSLRYAALAVSTFRARQTNDKYWENQTFQARDSMFADAFFITTSVGWFMAHGIEYGVYLELANDRKNEAIRPIIAELAPKFYADARRIYGG
jgi:hypothetical protein